MTSAPDYASNAPSRGAIDALPGPVMLEFGTDWCGYCRASAHFVAQALATHPAIVHLKVEDGPGRTLGRSFQVKLWRTLVFLIDEKEVKRLARTTDGVTLNGWGHSVAGA
jgi:thioredoxin 1